MRTYFKLLNAFILLTCVLVNVHAVEGNLHSIILDKQQNLLIAPDASAYQWYFHGEKIQHSGKTLRIMAPGTYEVVMRGADGEKSVARITIGINSQGEVYTIYIIGDSTACEWTYNYPLTGWGQVLRHFFDSDVIIKDKALSGRSSKSFYNDHWAPVRDSLKPGDFVFIQFGINDRADDEARHTEPFTTFQDYLSSFVNESRAKGALPVLLTTVRRNAWNETEPPTLYPAYHDYPVATRQLAGTLGVPLIDIDQLAIPLMEGLGPDYTAYFMYMHFNTVECSYYNLPTSPINLCGDDTHFQEMGAIEMARLVVEAIEGAEEDTVLNRLIPHVKPMHKVTTSCNFPEGAMITRSASYPEGLSVTLKALLDPAYDLLRWQDENGETLGVEDRYQFTMGNDSVSVTAILDDDPVADCLGEWNGTAYLDACNDCVGGPTGYKPCYPDLEEDTLKVLPVQSGFCLEEVSYEGIEKKYITQEACRNVASQAWIFTRDGNFYQIKNVGSENYLSVGSLSVLSYLTTSTEPFSWRIESYGQDTIQIVPSEDYDFIMEVSGNLEIEGKKMWLNRRHDRTNERFTLDAVESETLGIEDTKSYDCISVNPNPFYGETVIRLANASGSAYSVSCFDVSGKELIKMEGKGGQELKFGAELSKGMYIVKVSVGNNIQTLKLLKN